MNSSFNKEPRIYSIHTTEDKFFFALYLNIAQNNIDKVLKKFEGKFNVPDENESGNYKSYHAKWLERKLPITNLNVFEAKDRLTYLRRFFPFIETEFTIGEYQTYRNKLLMLFERLNDLRNFFTHVYYEKNELDFSLNKNLFSFLNEIKGQALNRLNQEPYNFKDESLQHLYNSDYRFNFQKEENVKDAINFFVCLFLDRRYAHEYLKKQKGYKSSHTPEHRATLKTYTFYSIKLPRPVFESRDMEFRLILDALNELKRCPKELYYHLPDDYRKLCEVESVKQKEDEETGEVEDIKEQIPFIRHEDRFPYYALRFIDDLEFLKNIQFRIKLGLGREYFHTHDDATQPVVRNKKVFDYGRLKDILENYNKNLAGENNNNKPEPYNNLWHFAPAYEIDRDGNIKIQIMPEEGNNSVKKQPAYAQISTYELRNILYCCLNGKKDAVNNIIRDYVTNYQSFLLDLKKKDFPQIDYSAELNTRRKQLDNLLIEKYNLRLQYLPKKLKQLLLGEEVRSYKAHTLKKIKLRKEENKRYLNRIERELNKNAQESNSLKTGQVASELAKDIQNYLPKNHKLELFQYRDLQKKLAYYRKNEIFALINQEYVLAFHKQHDRNENFKDLFYKKKHPFLHHVLCRKDNHDIFSFAYNYFKAKDIWFKKSLDYIDQLNDKDIPNYSRLFYYFKPGTSVNDKGEKIYYRKYDDQYLKELIEKHLREDHIINIPRGIFNKIIYTQNKKNSNEQEEKETPPIQQISENYPSTQDFYSFPRYFHPTEEVLPVEKIHYKLVELSQNYPQNKDKKEHKIAYRKLKNYLKKEKTIRYHQSCDRILLEMIKYYLNHYVSRDDQAFGLDLSDINLRDLYRYDQSKGVVDNALDNKMIQMKYKVNEETFTVNDRLNNFGKLHPYIYDERFVRLFKYKGKKAFEGVKTQSVYSQIEEVLKNFVDEQLDVFEAAQKFENIITSKYENEMKQKRGRSSPEHYFPISLLLEGAVDIGFISVAEKDYMKKARNSAAHNELSDSYIQLLKNDEKEEGYFKRAAQLFNYITKKIQKS
jgi:hypothetical protein